MLKGINEEMKFNKSDWRTYEQAIQKEWLLTNGIGGFSSSTIIGSNARRYHGLLFASFNPPIERHLFLSKIDETVFIDSFPYNIHSFSTGDYKMTGYNHQQEFSMDSIVHYKYLVKNIIIEKKITMVHGRNAVAIIYRVKNTEHNTRLRLAPLVNFRDFHHISRRENLNFNVKKESTGLIISPVSQKNALKIMIDKGEIIRQDNNWFNSMYYDIEKDRGLDAFEDHYIPCHIEISLKPWEEKELTVYAEVGSENDSEFREMAMPDGKLLLENEINRIKGIQDKINIDDAFAKTLAAAADTFIVQRKSTKSKTIIAGYPWFSDWGRDVMIAFPGLTLATGRYDDAKQILYTYSKYVKDGLIPNMFPDAGNEPLYNSVDAALWFFEAVNKYLEYTDDMDFIKTDIYKSLVSIIEHFKNGTIFSIYMDEDGLISSGDKDTQLTWMDAKVGDWVVTPRHGKAVEINALWYNALKVMEKISENLKYDSAEYTRLSNLSYDSFADKFWNDDLKCLHDVIGDGYIDSRVRPNQIFAVSLSFQVISGKKAEAIVRKVWDELYTPFGLRSLAEYEAEYRGTYSGDQHSRDGAYHQGTVWGWLTGHFITAFLRVYKNKREIAKEMIEPFKSHIYDGCIGTISEIFEGYEPHYPRGCFAQAWSVAEVLRVYLENELY